MSQRLTFYIFARNVLSFIIIIFEELFYFIFEYFFEFIYLPRYFTI